ncbi:MAG: S1C family serine protease [Candidatus Sumerlaeota bacterium]|nr:S1C family serine protease [Candidatus Sumerlaeota bacterium]
MKTVRMQNTKKIRNGVYCILICGALGLMGCATNGALNGDALYDKVKAASVEVLAGGQLAGGGWFATPDGLIVTASHVALSNRNALEILSPETGRTKVTLVALDRGNDLALLQAPQRAKPYPTLDVADRIPEVGEDIFLFGPPIFRHQVMARGAVARPDATFEYLYNLQCYARVYHIAAVAPIGFSGGCWVDRQGRVTGSEMGEMSINGASKGIAFATPPDAIRALLAARRSAVTPTIGCSLEELWERPPQFIAQFTTGSSGLLVTHISPGGPVEKAGLKANDLIVAANGKKMTYRDEALAMIRSHKPGDEMILKVFQPNAATPKEVKVRLERTPNEAVNAKPEK